MRWHLVRYRSNPGYLVEATNALDAKRRLQTALAELGMSTRLTEMVARRANDTDMLGAVELQSEAFERTRVREHILREVR